MLCHAGEVVPGFEREACHGEATASCRQLAVAYHSIQCDPTWVHLLRYDAYHDRPMGQHQGGQPARCKSTKINYFNLLRENQVARMRKVTESLYFAQ
jgi:hypothetical protein